MLDYFILLDLNDDFVRKTIFEQVLIFFFTYCVMNFFAWSTVIELIWPTHYFNRRHTSSTEFIKFRTYTEVLLKLSAYNDFFYILNNYYFNQKLILKN
uniref:Ymf56 n=1 Tax=Tetrahymena rostrata TaxID=5909 RepID=A0A650DEI7_TETRO|nr:Ymf56 [Tetrahymena rostrata]QBI37902.1 Ymf56 [Tetrahymena rostrata]QBI37946.1 Ymf56 [Tetrahymena rostrata]QGS65281.1 Ymf56 [Tetrahymena rostrata]URP31138.1 Ymf56 [Tetrahymena rostrata]